MPVMLTRRSLLHVLLSLLLLLSQQMAMAHAMSHWTSSLAPAAERQSSHSELSSAFAHDRSCAQCLAFAQIGTAVGSTARQFAPPETCSQGLAGATPRALASRTVRLFDSRAPPVFA
jgi:hypothetical protein